MTRRIAAGAAALLAVVLPAGCGVDDAGSAPTPAGATTASATAGSPQTSSTPTTLTAAPSTPITDGPTSPPAGPPSKVVAVHRRTVAADTAEQKAVADAYLNYVTVRLIAFNKAAVDTAALGRVASGTALSTVTGRVAKFRAERIHTIGEVWVDLPTITVKGTTASLRSCMDNTTIDVNHKGTAVELPVPYYVATATLNQSADKTWRVATSSIKNLRC